MKQPASMNPLDCEDGFDPMRFHLSNGSHGDTYQGECCAIELSNRATVMCPTLREKYGAAESFSDDHPSISRVVRSYVIGLNEAWGDEQRQKLRPYAVRVLGTNTGPADDETRAWMGADWLARVHCPAFLRLAGLDEHARVLEGLARIVDAITARVAQPSLDAARDRAAAARAAAWAGARAAAWDAARAAARDAAWAAAGAAARAAAGDAARAAAGPSAMGGAWERLRLVIETLQASSLELLDSMIAPLVPLDPTTR